MLRAASLCLIVCLSSLALAQKPSPQIHSGPLASSAVQVVYVIDGSTLTTYGIDPQTLYATQVGTLTLPESTYPNIVSSSNDRFLYYTAFDSPLQGSPLHLWVYATDASGAPQTPAVQKIDANGWYGGPSIDPQANFFYAVHAGSPGPQYTTFTIRRYLVDSNTGKISQLQVEAQYELANDPSAEDCGLNLDGFSADGSRLYDQVSCSYPGGDKSLYNQRTINPQTGTLGPDAEIYSWNNSSQGGEGVQFVNDLMFDFVVPNGYQQGIEMVNIYEVQPNVTTPLVQCTASMLEACGYFSGPSLVHPSGKYLFLGTSQSTTQIEKVELSAQKIVDTSNYIPYGVERFSPDGTIAYAVNYSSPGFYLEIYGFNVSTAGVTPGGIIDVPSAFDTWFTAVRY
ncbi:MAG: hypothetical protein ACLP56_11815 [Candidatus Sulfotelmatobacter sp.]